MRLFSGLRGGGGGSEIAQSGKRIASARKVCNAVCKPGIRGNTTASLVFRADTESELGAKHRDTVTHPRRETCMSGENAFDHDAYAPVEAA